MKLRLGIIGAGNIASAHIQNVLDGKCPNIEIVAVADRKESRRQWAAEKLPDAQCVRLAISESFANVIHKSVIAEQI